jgi:multidrug efflux pump subunit AcrA (membrane-fusion protein)
MRREWVILLVGLAWLPGLAQAGAGKIYKWVDEKGVTHYGQSIPVEYKDQAATEMNKQGVTMRKLDAAAVAAEQRKAAEERAVKEREDKLRNSEQRRRDLALINTYTSVREIDEHRDRSLQVPMQTLRGLEPRMRKAQERLESLKSQAAALSKKGKSTENVELDIADEKAEIDGIKAEMDRGQSQIEAIRAKFDADKKRFMELSQPNPSVSSSGSR